MMTIKIVPDAKVSGRLADAELHFGDGALAGLKLIGFGVWERRTGGRNVTFPARQYSVNGERRSFSLLRPVMDTTAQDAVRDAVLQAFESFDARGTDAPFVAEADASAARPTIKIVPNENGNPPGKLADVELHFSGGLLAGLKLIGFGIWERKTGAGRNVTFPARQYSVSGERRTFALLRPSSDTDANNLRDLILDAYAEYEAVSAATA